jgi:TonB-dependent starch-binding outer membrane protein SusC
MSKLRWLPLLLMALGIPALASAQERTTVTGTVTEAGTGTPLRNAQVTIPGLNVSIPTDQNGRFTLRVPRGTFTLRINMIGYKSGVQQLVVADQPMTANFALETDPLGLDELVVVGYGEERRRNLAGAVSSLRPEAAKEIPVTSINQVMQGRMPGVQITQNSGTPGSAISVRVRGSSSISGGNEPLYVIDGVPVTQGDYSAITQVSFGGQDVDAVSDLSPNDIETIEVLKDASAAAIYGSRASNGVVLIKTKRGQSDRPEITFNAYYGLQKDWRRLDMLNSQQYIEIYTEGSDARFGTAAANGLDAWYCYEGQGDCDVTIPTGADTDWLDQVLQEAPMSNMELAIRGGSERVRYYVSGAALDQDGTVKATGYGRLNGRVNLDYQPFEKLSLGTNVSLARSLNKRQRMDNTIYGAWSNAMANPPIEPVYDENGEYYETTYANPVGMYENSEAEERNIRILGNVFAQYSLLNGVYVRGSVGLDQVANRSRAFDSPAFGPWASSGGAAESGTRFVNKLTYEGTVNFQRALGTDHEFSGVVGTSFEDNVNERTSVQGTKFPTEYFKYIESAALVSTGTSSRSDWTLMSYFGRLSWTFDERITTTFNVRRDGSSRFGADNRFGTFPSASVLWRVGDESFMKSQDFLRNLAFRASYGVTGNQQDLGNFASRGLWRGGANYQDNPGILPSQLANPSLRWEKTKQMNLGTDFSVLRDRLAFTFDYYDKRTTDLLVEQAVPRTTGYSSIWSNVGAMKNTGVELAVRATLLQPRATSGLGWVSSLSLSRNRNEVTELYNNTPINSGFASRVEVGKPLGFFYGYVTDGIFQSQAEVAAHATQTVHSNPRRATSAGDIRFKDINGRDASGQLTGQPDGKINADDQTMIGDPWPEFEGGWTNQINFKSFDLNAFVQFSMGNDIFNGNRIYMDQYGSGGDNHTTRALDRWTPTNTNTTEPRAVWGDPNLNTRDSDRFIEDGSYVRLKNVVLGYTLPTSLSSKMGFRTTRIYLQGQNLITSTDYSGFDPEVNYGGQTAITRGTDFYTMPQARTLTFGLNVGF